MKAKAAIVQGALALGALGAAYTTWQRPPALGPGDVTVLSLSRHDLQSVRFQSPDRTVVLTRGELHGDPVVWVDEDEHPTPRPSIGGKTPPPLPSWHRTLVGNEQASKVLEQLTPLQAVRALGKLEDAKLKELGLADPKRHLEVDAEGAKYQLALSIEPAGLEQPYVRRASDGQVFLLGGMLVADLDTSLRLVDRKLHGFPPDTFDTVTLEAGGKKKTFHAKLEPGQFLPHLTADGEAKPDPSAKAWHDLLWRSRATELLGKGEAPKTGEPTTLVKVEYTRRGRPVGHVELGKSGTSYFARSEHTAGWVQLGGPVDDLVRQSEQLAAK